ncbi:hypothetical protein R3P38DRAFT_2814606 [Favolaschia claudopus]|uniref:Uncharacterized protein n=1 Tax=Favolaschia claudopus TaxID=2862362 RepID=A0AAV9Z2T2_9AGAR
MPFYRRRILTNAICLSATPATNRTSINYKSSLRREGGDCFQASEVVGVRWVARMLDRRTPAEMRRTRGNAERRRLAMSRGASSWRRDAGGLAELLVNLEQEDDQHCNFLSESARSGETTLWALSVWMRAATVTSVSAWRAVEKVKESGVGCGLSESGQRGGGGTRQAGVDGEVNGGDGRGGAGVVSWWKDRRSVGQKDVVSVGSKQDGGDPRSSALSLKTDWGAGVQEVRRARWRAKRRTAAHRVRMRRLELRRRDVSNDDNTRGKSKTPMRIEGQTERMYSTSERLLAGIDESVHLNNTEAADLILLRTVSKVTIRSRWSGRVWVLISDSESIECAAAAAAAQMFGISTCLARSNVYREYRPAWLALMFGISTCLTRSNVCREYRPAWLALMFVHVWFRPNLADMHLGTGFDSFWPAALFGVGLFWQSAFLGNRSCLFWHAALFGTALFWQLALLGTLFGTALFWQLALLGTLFGTALFWQLALLGNVDRKNCETNFAGVETEVYLQTTQTGEHRLTTQRRDPGRHTENVEGTETEGGEDEGKQKCMSTNKMVAERAPEHMKVDERPCDKTRENTMSCGNLQ